MNNIELEKTVVSSDGDEVGHVDGLIIDRNTMSVSEFVIKHGTVLTTERVVDFELVDRIDPDGTIYIRVTSDEVDSLEPFVENRNVPVGEHEMNTMPHAWVSGTGGGAIFWGPAGPGRGEPGRGSMFEPAAANPPPTVPQGSISDQEILIDEGMNVIGRDEDSLGTVEEVLYDGQGRLNGFRVQAGLVFTRDVIIGMNLVDEIRHDGVKLTVAADEAESAGAVE
jgi:uncharacterized protein YrrD